MNSKRYDVIVIGTGHSGVEAGLASARMGCRTLMFTLDLDSIAMMPCNPSIGGPAKGHLVREIDALGGEMARHTDQHTLQVKMLNTGKGPAVQALRAQVDKQAYSRGMKRVLLEQERLDLIEAMVSELLVTGDGRAGRVSGVRTDSGVSYHASAVVLTAGVYMESQTVTGQRRAQGGPNGRPSSRGLSADLERLGLEMGRFKTGTPPRLAKDSIDYSLLEAQWGDPEPQAFSFMTDPESLVPAEGAEGDRRRELPCWTTYTSDKTHEIIRNNLDQAPLYNGDIEGTGPRYCPSIEDKVVRFADRERHQVILEPQGWSNNRIYPLGLSTSLPLSVQKAMVHSIRGLEQANIVKPGYAIEYDYLVPTQLRRSLETQPIRGLFSAGQVNGTSGYEEAAAQGLVAGINAALRAQDKPPLVLDRSDAYIGVLIDDLTTKGPREPYRMFTSRAEYRLLLRFDNADLRLTERGRQVGLVTDQRYDQFKHEQNLIAAERKRLETTRLTPTQDVRKKLERLGSGSLRQPASLSELLRRPEVSYEDLAIVDSERPPLPTRVCQQVEIQCRYQAYIQKQERQIERFRKMESRSIPDGFFDQPVRGISNEAMERLAAVQPETVGQARRMPAVRSADLSVLLVRLEAAGKDDGGAATDPGTAAAVN